MVEISRGTTPDGRFTYLEAGSASGLPVVFLHGIGGGARLWTGQLGRFGRSYRAIAWDMPGYGSSAALEGAPSIGAFAAALSGFLSSLGLDRPVLVGHSIGGMIVQAYLAEALGPVRGAVLAQTSPAFGGRDPAWARDFVEARLGPLDRGEGMADLADASISGMIGDAPDEAGIALARAVMTETSPAAYRASTLAMLGFDQREALAQIAVPVLLLAGSRDANAPAATMAKMAEKIPGAEIVTVEGAGHLLMLERPGAFDEPLAAFLQKVDRA